MDVNALIQKALGSGPSRVYKREGKILDDYLSGKLNYDDALKLASRNKAEAVIAYLTGDMDTWRRIVLRIWSKL